MGIDTWPVSTSAKVAAIRRLQRREISLEELAKEQGVSVETIEYWQAKIDRGLQSIFTAIATLPSDPAALAETESEFAQLDAKVAEQPKTEPKNNIAQCNCSQHVEPEHANSKQLDTQNPPGE